MGYTESFSVELIQQIAKKLSRVLPGFSFHCDFAQIGKKLEALPLKGRLSLIAGVLQENFQMNSCTPTVRQWVDFFGEELPSGEGIFNLGYWLMPISTWLEEYQTEDFDYALSVMYELTKRNTAEYCIRPFIVSDYDRLIDLLKKWVEDESFHVRRLVSEGLRPRLPWAKKLSFTKTQYSGHLNLLMALSNDESLYVRKSVANHLRDICKEEPELCLDPLGILQKGSVHQRWIAKHALRGNLLLKSKL
jgi:3-methyladenine DNA glycosylase AlkC